MSALAQVQISEVLYDPVNTESGGEAVELYNPDSSPADISGWSIRTETSLADATIPAGKIIQPKAYFLIADAGFSTSKDNPAWPDADYEEAITLTNTDSGIALVSNGTLVDAVGWGSAAGIDEGLYEGSPHPGTSSGQSLQRVQDSNDNSQDFIPAAPNLQSSSYIEGNTLQFHITVTESAPTVDSISISLDDDTTKSGVQVTPQPKAKKQIPLNVIVNNEQGYNNTKYVSASLGSEKINLTISSSLNATAVEYSGSIGINFYEDPGNYTMTIEAVSTSGTKGSKPATFEYLSLIGLEIDASSISCAGNSGDTCNVLGDADINSTNKATVRNIGNVVIDSEVSGTDFNSGSAVIPVGNVKYAFNPTLSQPQTLTASPVVNQVGLVHGTMSTKEISFGVTIPSSAAAGDYVGTIKLVAVQS